MPDEPLFMSVRSDSPEFLETVRDAQSSLTEFRRRLAACDLVESSPCVKVRLVDGDECAFLWLLVVSADETSFVGSIFEIPPEFKSYRVGDELTVEPQSVLDWMINENGTLHGGYSLRYQRNLLPEHKRSRFDEHIGVTRYA